jgi:transmembrane 9 superfamily protein 2/4
MTMTSLVGCAALLIATAHAFYIPGVSPTSYSTGQPLLVRVNALTSNQGVMPFPFYTFKSCVPSAERLKKEKKKENLGEVLWGEQIEPSELNFEMLKNVSCRALCDTQQYDDKEMATLKKLIEQQYRGNLVMDNLPVAQQTNAGPRFPKLLIGYPLGVSTKLSPDQKALINNHIHYSIHYHIPDEVTEHSNEESYRIVGFYAAAHSVKHTDKSPVCKEGTAFVPDNIPYLTTDTKTIKWTYSVSWHEEVDLAWATRWDVYMRGGEHDDKIHWFAIMNSLLVVLFLSGLVAMIMIRVLHRDFSRYNAEAATEVAEESGWKMVHGDVFRPPSNGWVLAALVGSGSQLCAMTTTTLIIACLGFLSPSNRGGLLTAIILLFVLLGSFAGFVASRLLKYFKKQSWLNAFLVAFIGPAVIFGIYFGLNLVQWAKHASSAIPLTTLALIIALWFCVSMPLVLLGAAIGFRRPAMEFATRVNAVPRLIPEQKWFMESWVVVPVAGMLPFGAAFIELIYILSSFWQGRVYYVFGFLALVVLLLFITCVEVVIVATYMQLCFEDYHWWWRSFLMSASSGAYLYLYSIYYLCMVLTIRQPTSVVLYLGYMLIGSLLFAVATGAVGFFAAFFFTRRIYGAIKID